MTFERPVTFLVGENGSRKPTAKAFTEAWGLDAWGRAGRKYVNDRSKAPRSASDRSADQA
ncbi:putative ATPase [Lentzea nigeriaca]|nr:putative ATPase [Lentzea nigeriaca]